MKLIVDKNLHHLIPKFEKHPDDNTIVSKDSDGGICSLFSHVVWDFSAYDISNKNSSNYKISFAGIKDKKLLHDLKLRLYYIIQAPVSIYTGDRKNAAFTTICGNASLILRQTAFFTEHNKEIRSLSHPFIWSLFVEYLKTLELAAQTYEGHLTAIKWLEEANPYLELSQHLLLPAFERDELARELAPDHKKDKTHTPYIINQVAQPLYKLLIDEIENGYSLREELKDTKLYAQKYDISEKEAHMLKVQLTSIALASIMAFTGMRISEAVAIKSNAFVDIEVDGLHLYALKGKTYKLEHGLERTDIWCCAPILQKAIELVHEIWVNERVDENELFQISNWNYSKDGSFSSFREVSTWDKAIATKRIKELAKDLSIPYLKEWDKDYLEQNPKISKKRDPRKLKDDGTYYWYFSSHSFRKTFAMFGVGYGLITLASVKQQFHHVHVSMTGVYTANSEILTLLRLKKDTKIIEDIEKAEIKYKSEYLHNVFDEGKTNSGGFAKKVLGEGKPRVLSEEEFEKIQSNPSTRGRSTGYGTCFSKEECDMKHVFQPDGCIGKECEGLSISYEEGLRWQKRHNEWSVHLHKMISDGIFSRNKYTRWILDIRTAEKVMNDHSIEYTRFEAAL